MSGSAESLTTILGGRVDCSHIVIRAGDANVNSLFVGKNNVTTGANRLGYLKPDESLTVDIVNGYLSSDEIYIVGTAAELVHVIVLQ